MGWFVLQLQAGSQTHWVPESSVKKRLLDLCEVRPFSGWAYPLLCDLVSETGERLLLGVLREFKKDPLKLQDFFGIQRLPERYELVIVWRRSLIAG